MLVLAYKDHRINLRLYSKETKTWTPIPDTIEIRGWKPAIVATKVGSQNRVYLFGGSYRLKLYDSIEYLDICDNPKWIKIESTDPSSPSVLTTSRYHTAAALLDSTTVIICGGLNHAHNGIKSCESFNTTTHIVSPFPDMLGPRARNNSFSFFVVFTKLILHRSRCCSL